MQKSDDRNPSDQVKQYLLSYQIPYPSEDEIMGTIDNLRQYVPSKRKGTASRYEALKRIMTDTFIMINFMSVSYWVITFVLYAIGYLAVIRFFLNPYKLSFIFAPMPMILGLIEVFRGREEGVTELELSCKISPQELFIAKILVVGIYTTILNLSLSLILFFQGQADIMLWRITFLWLVPMILIGSITLWFCSKIKGNYSVMLSLLCWSGAAYLFVTNEHLFRNLLYLNPLCYIMLLSIGIGIFTKEIINLKNRYILEGRPSAWS